MYIFAELKKAADCFVAGDISKFDKRPPPSESFEDLPRKLEDGEILIITPFESAEDCDMDSYIHGKRLYYRVYTSGPRVIFEQVKSTIASCIQEAPDWLSYERLRNLLSWLAVPQKCQHG